MMNASKENARKARAALSTLLGTAAVQRGEVLFNADALEQLQGFIAAAERKLPSEAAYKADKARRKQAKIAKAIDPEGVWSKPVKGPRVRVPTRPMSK
jgi:hypothetical protein